MSGTVGAIISGTILIIVLFIILTNGSNAVQVINSIGSNYANIVKVLMARA